MSYLPAGSLHQLLAMERNPLTSVLVLSLSVFLGGAGSVRLLFFQPRLSSRFDAGRVFLFGGGSVSECCKWTERERERERERENAFSFPPVRPGPGCYNVTMEEEILPCSRIYTYCDITGMLCAGAGWVVKCFCSNVLVFLGGGASLFTLSRSEAHGNNLTELTRRCFNINTNLHLIFFIIIIIIIIIINVSC